MNDTRQYVDCEGGITAPVGYRAAGLLCGIRKQKKDLALLTSDRPAVTAAVFTQNAVKAAPLLVTMAQLKTGGLCSAILVNSGNANACTGQRGLDDAWAMVRRTAECLGVPENQVLVSSTGVIGQYLPMDKIVDGIGHIVPQRDREGHRDAAEAIMTTDTRAKEVAVRLRVGRGTVTIGGMAKGSGMIAPNMATMLGFLTTDAAIDGDLLEETFQRANQRSFNRITVDGDMSTNDMAVILANGCAGNEPIERDSPEHEDFSAALEYVMTTLAKMIARDGEGATKLIEVSITGAHSPEEALLAARAVAGSNLVKTAIHGADANWGRILAALGYSGVDLKGEEVEIAFNGVPILGKGYRILLNEERAKEALMKETVVLSVNLNGGTFSEKFWTCDLTKEYVHINASYRS
jgi:glutamate N-acetyltransferase / amino-acid N-acetyltransferase